MNKERYEECAFYNIMEKGPTHKQKIVFENLCKPCKEECPVNLPILEFTGDSVVPYIEKGDEVDPPFVVLSTIDKYIQTIRKKP